MTDRDAAVQTIRSNIEKSGYHVYVVAQGVLPRFAYTIGLSERLGLEVVLPGAIFFNAEEVLSIIDGVAKVLAVNSRERLVAVHGCGQFTLAPVHPTWASSLLLGAMDYYGKPSMAALQVVPDQEHWTGDVPDLSRPWSATDEPVWQWLHVDWPHSVPSDSTVVADLWSISGERVLELVRWEESHWEMFSGSGSEFAQDQVRVVPLAMMLALDETLAAALELSLGEGLFRESGAEPWQVWRKR